MKMTRNGVSTCPPGGERYERFQMGPGRATRVHYDYRTAEGELFTCVDKTLEQCRARRDKWLLGKRKEFL